MAEAKGIVLVAVIGKSLNESMNDGHYLGLHPSLRLGSAIHILSFIKEKKGSIESAKNQLLHLMLSDILCL